LISVAFL